MASFVNILIISVLLLLWVIAGGYVTTASALLNPYKDKSEDYGRAFGTSTAAAVITWVLVGFILIGGVLAFLGVGALFVGLFGSGVGEAGAGVAAVGEGGLLAAEGAEAGVAGLEGAEALEEAEEGGKALKGGKKAVKASKKLKAGKTELRQAETSIEKTVKEAEKVEASATATEEEKKVAEKEIKEAQKAEKTVKKEEAVESKKPGLATETINWVEYVLIAVAFTLSFTTGILSAIAANSLNKTGFDRSDGALVKAYDYLIISASLTLGSSGLIILGFLSLEIYRYYQEQRVINVQKIAEQQAREEAEIKQKKAKETKEKIEELQRKSLEEEARHKAEAKAQLQKAQAEHLRQVQELQQAKFEVEKQKIYQQAGISPAGVVSPQQAGVVPPSGVATQQTLPPPSQTPPPPPSQTLSPPSGILLPPSQTPPPKGAPPPPSSAPPSVPLGGASSPAMCYSNLGLKEGADSSQAIKQYAHLQSIYPPEDCEKNDCCRRTFEILKDSTRKIISGELGSGCLALPACKK